MKQREKIIQEDRRVEAKNKAFYESVLKQQKEIELRYQQAKEMLTNAKKTEADTETKIQKIQKENSQLQSELNAARQRAKRLAKKRETRA
jgi:hypothetical protein